MSTHRRNRSELAADVTLTVFRLNGQLLAAGEQMARPVGLTVARWQVLGAILRQPGTVSDISRQMGLSRQAVQRVADRLLDEGMIEKRANRAHKRAPLMAPTKKGRDAVAAIGPHQRTYAARLVAKMGREELESLAAGLDSLSEVLDQVQP